MWDIERQIEIMKQEKTGFINAYVLEVHYKNSVSMTCECETICISFFESSLLDTKWKWLEMAAKKYADFPECMQEIEFKEDVLLIDCTKRDELIEFVNTHKAFDIYEVMGVLGVKEKEE